MPAFLKKRRSLTLTALVLGFGLLGLSLVAQSSIQVEKLRWPINTGAADLAPTISANGQVLIFQSNRGGGKGSHDLYESNWQGTRWSQPVNLRVVNSKYFEGFPSLSGDGKTLFFSTNRHTDDPNDPDYDIWVSRRTLNNQWSQPKPIQVLNSDDFDGMVSLTFDNKTLYFTSDRADGIGKMDIWQSKWKNGYWQKPVVLGRPINSEANDANPYVTPAGDLFYFVSEREGGYGKYDLYRATRPYSAARWRLPVNVGPQINTRTNEYFFSLPNIGSTMYISRGDDGNEDIYHVTLPPSMQSTPVVLIRARVIDDQTREPLEDVPVAFEMVSAGRNPGFKPPRKLLYRSGTVTGEINVTLLAGTEYNAVIRYKDYSTYKKYIDLRGVYQSEERDLVIEISNRAVIDKFAGVYFKTNDTQLSDEAKVSLRLYIAHLKQHPKSLILLAGYADSRGYSDFNRSLGRARAESVRNYLVESGINPARIFTSGGGIKGDTEKVFNAEKLQYFRTVQIKILKQ